MALPRHVPRNGLLLTGTVILVLFSYVAALRLPPSIVAEPRMEYIYRIDESVELPCRATGEPQPMYTWLKNGDILDLNQQNIKRIETTSDGTIVIEEFTSLDEGYYQCVASNQYGKSLSNVVLLRRAVLGSFPPAAVQTYTVTEGESLMVPCRGVKSVPQPSFSWDIVRDQIDDNPVTLATSTRVQIDDTGNLYFSHVTMNDAQDGKQYKCNVFNPHLDITTGGSYSQITVLPNSNTSVITPQLLFASPSSVIAIKGEQFKIKCFFSGRPVPTVDWERVGSELPEGRSRTINFDTELEVTNAAFEDEGVYTCYTTGNETREIREFFVDVQSKPSFTVHPVNINATEGDTVQLECRAEADPAVKIMWLINGEPLSSLTLGARKKISSDGQILTISDLCKDCPDGSSDLMVIQCNATNVHGYVFSDSYLNVLDQTVITKSPETVRLEGDLEDVEEVSFECEAESDDATPVLYMWLLNDNPINFENAEDITLEDNNVVLNLKNKTLDEMAEYQGTFKCVATNGYSEATATANLEIPGLANGEGERTELHSSTAPVLPTTSKLDFSTVVSSAILSSPASSLNSASFSVKATSVIVGASMLVTASSTAVPAYSSSGLTSPGLSTSLLPTVATATHSTEIETSSKHLPSISHSRPSTPSLYSGTSRLTSTPPLYTGSAGFTSTPALFTGSSEFTSTPPLYSGSSEFTSTPSLFTGTSRFTTTPPLYSGTSRFTSTPPLFTGSAGFTSTPPLFTGSSEFTSTPPLYTGSSEFTSTPPLFTGTSRFTSTPPLYSGTSRYTSAPPFFTGSSRFTSTPPLATGSSGYTSTPPFFTGSSWYTSTPPLYSRTSRYTSTPPLSTGSSGFTSTPPLSTGSSEFTSTPPLATGSLGYTRTPPLFTDSSRFTSTPPLFTGSSGFTSTPPLFTGLSRFTSTPPLFTGSSGFTSTPPLFTGSSWYTSTPPLFTGSSGFTSTPPLATGSSGFTSTLPLSTGSSGFTSTPPLFTGSSEFTSTPSLSTGSSGFTSTPPLATGSSGFTSTPPLFTGSSEFTSTPSLSTGSSGFTSTPPLATGSSGFTSTLPLATGTSMMGRSSDCLSEDPSALCPTTSEYHTSGDIPSTTSDTSTDHSSSQEAEVGTSAPTSYEGTPQYTSSPSWSGSGTWSSSSEMGSTSTSVIVATPSQPVVSEMYSTTSPAMSYTQTETVPAVPSTSESPDTSVLFSTPVLPTSDFGSATVGPTPPLFATSTVDLQSTADVVTTSPLHPTSTMQLPSTSSETVVKPSVSVVVTESASTSTISEYVSEVPTTESPYAEFIYKLTFKGNCSVVKYTPGVENMFKYKVKMLIVEGLRIDEDKVRVDNLTCGSVNVIVAIQELATRNLTEMLEYNIKKGNMLVEVPSPGNVQAEFIATSMEVIEAPTQAPPDVHVTPKPPKKKSKQGLNIVEIIIIIVVSVVAGSLLLFGLGMCIYECNKRKYSKSFDLGNTPRAQVTLEDFTLTKMNRPQPHYNDTGPVIRADNMAINSHGKGADLIIESEAMYSPTNAEFSTFRDSPKVEREPKPLISDEEMDVAFPMTKKSSKENLVLNVDPPDSPGIDNPSFSSDDILDSGTETDPGPDSRDEIASDTGTDGAGERHIHVAIGTLSSDSGREDTDIHGEGSSGRGESPLESSSLPPESVVLNLSAEGESSSPVPPSGTLQPLPNVPAYYEESTSIPIPSVALLDPESVPHQDPVSVPLPGPDSVPHQDPVSVALLDPESVPHQDPVSVPLPGPDSVLLKDPESLPLPDVDSVPSSTHSSISDLGSINDKNSISPSVNRSGLPEDATSF